MRIPAVVIDMTVEVQRSVRYRPLAVAAAMLMYGCAVGLAGGWWLTALIPVAVLLFWCPVSWRDLRWLAGLVVCVGCLLGWSTRVRHDYLAHTVQTSAPTIARVVQPPALYGYRWAAILQPVPDPAERTGALGSARIWAVLPERPDVLQRGDTVRITGRLTPVFSRSNTSWHRWLLGRGVHAEMRLSTLQVLQHAPVDRMDALRYEMGRGIIETAPPGRGEITAAVALGLRSGLPKTLKHDLQASGIFHILSPSGTNVSSVVAVVTLLCVAMGIGLRQALVLAIAPVWAFALLTGMEAPAVRSCLMWSVAALVIVASRDTDPPTAVSLALLALLLWQPGALWDGGVLFSYGTVAVLVAARGWIVGRSGRRSRWTRVTQLLRAGLVCAVGSLPLQLTHGMMASPAAPLTNLLTEPAAAVLITAGILQGLLAMVWTNAAVVVGWVNGMSAGWVIGVSSWMAAHIPSGRLEYGQLPLGLAVACVIIIGAVFSGLGWRQHRQDTGEEI